MQKLLQRLKLNEKGFEVVFEHATLGILIVAQSGEIIALNPYCADLFGYEKQELEGQTIEVLIPSSLRQKHKSSRQHYQKNPHAREMGKNMALTGLRKNGLEFPVEISLSPFTVEDEVFTVAFVIDITARKSAEMRIFELNQNYERLISNLPGMVYKFRADENLTAEYVSEGAFKLTGYSDTEICQQDFSFYDLIQEDDIQLVKANQSRAMEIESSYEMNYRILTKSGEERWIWDRGIVYREHGFVFIEGFMRDVTERIQSRIKLRELNQDLERRVERRTSELANALMEIQSKNEDLTELYEKTRIAENDAQRALEKERELNELKSRFVSMASHEFRTPLTTILSSANLIARYPEADHQEKREKNIARIRKSVTHLTTILTEFLSLEKLQSGMAEVHPEEMDAVTFFEDFLDDLSKITKPGQQIDFSFEGENRKAQLDPQAMRHVLNNLGSNAIKYSPENTTIKVRLERTGEDLKFSITDQGIGIPKADQEHLFSRFFRAGNVTNVQGTGLGLTIVMNYIEMMGGEISFESIENKGTTFHITIPQK